MDASADRPQIGPLEVEPEALDGPGAHFEVLVTQLGLDADEVPAGTPMRGWRVLHDHPERGVVLGAPADGHGETWRLAQGRPGTGAGARRVTLHPDTFPLRPSRAQRRRGLVLRWPEVVRSEPDLDLLAIDVLNAGDDRWRPAGDSFHVVGIIREPGAALGGYGYAFVGGRAPALPLDAGEYARVRVVIDAGQWQDLTPGRYHLHAALAELGVRAETPLELELTEELIERHRPRTNPRPAPPDRAAAMTDRLEIIRALLAAREQLPAVLEAITAATSDDDARRSIQDLLDCSPAAAEQVSSTSLRRFRPGRPDPLRTEAEELERAIPEAASGDSAPRGDQRRGPQRTD